MAKRIRARAAAFDPVTGRYPNERPANDRYLTALERTGTDFWRHRGVQVPDNVPVDVADDLRIQDSETATAYGRGRNAAKNGENRVVLQGQYAGSLLARAHDTRISAKKRRDALRYLGQIVTHELGHVGGLEHSTDGLMAENLSPQGMPWDVRVLSRQLIPDPPKRKKIRRHR